MKRNILLLLLLMTGLIKINAQYHLPQNKVWVMGNKAGLDFNTPEPRVITTNIQGSSEGSASICDSTGKLLFYTNGSDAWTATGVIMPNGTRFNGSYFSTISTTQGALIVPDPGNAQRYYLFSLTSKDDGRFFCDVVDMRLNRGEGDIDTTFPLHRVQLSDGLTEKMIAVPGCRNNVWILVHTEKKALFRVYELTDIGLNLIPTESGPGQMPAPAYAGGVIKASPDGKRLVACNTYDYDTGIEWYDFDPETGKASQAKLLDSGSYYGAAFSSNGQVLYAQSVSNSGIFQFNLQAANPALSRLYLGRSRSYSDMKLGPDAKVYFIGFPGTSATYLGRIEYLDVPGPGCKFRDSVSTIAFERSAYINIQYGLPNDVVVAVPPAYHSSGLVWDTLICKLPDTTGILLEAGSFSSSYQWYDGSTGPKKYLKESGIYWIRYFIESCGMHTDSFRITISGFPAWSIARNEEELETTLPFSSYQWYKEGQPLPGATQRNLPIGENGWYTVRVYNAQGCSDTTGLQVSGFTGTDKPSVTINNIIVYPNPAFSQLQVKAPMTVILKLYSIEGKIQCISRESPELDLRSIPSGIYFLYIYDTKGNLVQTIKIIKQEP